jgi:hypothetical protein
LVGASRRECDSAIWQLGISDGIKKISQKSKVFETSDFLNVKISPVRSINLAAFGWASAVRVSEFI